MQEAPEPPLPQPCPLLLTFLGGSQAAPVPCPIARHHPCSSTKLGTWGPAPAHFEGSKSEPTSSLSWAKVNLMFSWWTTKASRSGILCAVTSRHRPTVWLLRRNPMWPWT